MAGPQRQPWLQPESQDNTGGAGSTQRTLLPLEGDRLRDARSSKEEWGPGSTSVLAALYWVPSRCWAGLG